MKILYLGHYKEGTGWSKAAIDYIMALDSVGVDVVCRNIKLTDRTGEVPDRVLHGVYSAYIAPPSSGYTSL